jgi:hypothetical protein
MADNANVAGAPAPAPAAPEAAAPEVAAPLVADPNVAAPEAADPAAAAPVVAAPAADAAGEPLAVQLLSAKLQIAEMRLECERALREAEAKTAAAEARISQALLEAALARTGGPKPASEAPVVLYVPLNPDTVHAPSNYAKGSAFKPGGSREQYSINVHENEPWHEVLSKNGSQKNRAIDISMMTDGCLYSEAINCALERLLGMLRAGASGATAELDLDVVIELVQRLYNSSNRFYTAFASFVCLEQALIKAGNDNPDQKEMAALKGVKAKLLSMYGGKEIAGPAILQQYVEDMRTQITGEHLRSIAKVAGSKSEPSSSGGGSRPATASKPAGKPGFAKPAASSNAGSARAAHE